MILSITNLSKRYGKVSALDNLNLQVEKGTVHGILGPNGSGKTTTLGIILGVIHQDVGHYEWFGEKPGPDHFKRIGAILEYPNFYPYLDAVQNLKIIADIKECSYHRIDEVLELAGIYNRKNDNYRGYSLGMKQRLAIAAALLNKPEVLVLDEPTNGLDPQGIADVRDLIRNIASGGTTVLLASHLLDEVEKVCNHVSVLKLGNLLFSGSVAEVMGEELQVEVSAINKEHLFQLLQNFKGVKHLKAENDKYIVSLEEGFDSTSLNSYLFEKGLALSHLLVRKRSLESQFLQLLTGEK